MWRNVNFLLILQNFTFLHICCVEKSEIPLHVEKFQIFPHLSCIEISPHDQFFLHKYFGDISDKYQVCALGAQANRDRTGGFIPTWIMEPFKVYSNFSLNPVTCILYLDSMKKSLYTLYVRIWICWYDWYKLSTFHLKDGSFDCPTFITPYIKADIHHPRHSSPQTFIPSDVHHLRHSSPPT